MTKLEKSFREAEDFINFSQNRNERRYEYFEASILREFLSRRDFNKKKLDGLVREFFPDKKGALALFVSPHYGRSYLRKIIKAAEKGKIAEILEVGLFRYALTPELYRVIGRAYSKNELKLEKIDNLERVKILTKNSNSYFIEDKNLDIIAGVYREGIVLCNCLIQDSDDTSYAIRIHDFME